MTEEIHSTRHADMLREVTANIADPFDGGWRLKHRQQHAHTTDELKFFTIARGILTMSSLRTCRVQHGNDPDTIRFSDARGQLLLDDTLRISIANGPDVSYSRVDIPTQSTLSALQGKWFRQYKGLDCESESVREHEFDCEQQRDSLKVQGACVEVVQAGKKFNALLRRHKDDMKVILRKKVVHTSVQGSLFLQTPSGSLHHYSSSNLGVLECIPEERVKTPQ